MVVRFVVVGLAALILPGCSPSAAEPDKAAQVSVVAAPQKEMRDVASAHVVTDLPDGPLTSPLVIRGTVSGGFFYEGVFPVRLLGQNDAVIAEAPAMPGPKGWMTPDPVPFQVTLTFDVDAPTDAILVFEQDIVGEDPLPPLQVTRRVTLTPAG